MLFQYTTVLVSGLDSCSSKAIYICVEETKNKEERMMIYFIITIRLLMSQAIDDQDLD
jgi:hypothetical protein